MTDTKTTLAPTDAEILHLCGELSAMNPQSSGIVREVQIVRNAIAKWGAQPVAAPAGMEPVAYLIERSAFRVSPHGQDAEGKEWLEEAHSPDEPGAFAVFTAAQVQAMLSAGLAPGWQAVPVEPTEEMIDAAANVPHSGLDENYQWLPLSIGQYRAMLAATPIGPAREPLSQERLLFLSGEYEDIPEEGTAFRDGWRSAEMHYGITAAQTGDA